MRQRLSQKPRPSPIELNLPKAEQSRRTRSLILETGIQCLVDYGYTQTSMHLISKVAGISRGPLHYHFDDKNALMAGIAELLPMRASSAVLRKLSAAKTIEQRLTTLFDIGIEEHLGPHHFAAMELLMASRQDEGLRNAIGPHFQSSEAAFDDWWCGYLGLMNWPRERLLAFRTVLVACLRGLALDNVLNRDPKGHARAMELFREMFLQFALHDKAKP